MRPNRCTKHFPHGFRGFSLCFFSLLGVDRVARQSNSTNSTTSPIDPLTEEQGYQVHWKVLDAKSWVPQHRERIFVVGFREPNSFTFDDLAVPDPIDGPRLEEVLHPRGRVRAGGDALHAWPDGKGCQQVHAVGPPVGYLQSYARKHRAAGNGFGFGLVGPGDVSRTLSARYYKDGSEILVRQERGNPRRLTPQTVL